MAKQTDMARDRYQQFVIDGIGEEHRAEFHGGQEDSRVLGDDRFIEQTLGKPGLSPQNPLLSLDEKAGQCVYSQLWRLFNYSGLTLLLSLLLL